MTDQHCTCGAELGAGFTVCGTCHGGLIGALTDINAYHHEMNVIRARQARFGQAPVRSSDIPLGMDARFLPGAAGSEMEYDTRNTVRAWVGEVMKSYPTVASPYPTVAAMCRFLLHFEDWFRTAAAAPDGVDELCDLAERLRRMIDRPPDKWFAGPCRAELEGGGVCDEPLYAGAERGDVDCPACGSSYDVASRRAWLLESAEDYEAPATVIARAITAWGESDASPGTLAARIRQWGTRRRIFPIRHDFVDGVQRPLYRIGEVLDLLAEDARRAEERRHRASSRA